VQYVNKYMMTGSKYGCMHFGWT